MTDVIKLAQDKRARLMAEVEGRMAEIERLDGFILFGAKLSAEAAPVMRPELADANTDADQPHVDGDAAAAGFAAA